MLLSRRLLVLVLQWLYGVSGTSIKLRNGGFEDIIIAINPQLPEDPQILDSIKDMIKEGSTYLFGATQQRFYFKSVKIIIPLTWTTKTEYKRVTTESYEKADVIVAEPSQAYGDEPYTLQYGGCGEKGQYIHFTSKFLTDDKLIDAYGPRGRVFVHEWAHLRWGVFDEYNYDAPFYVTGPNKAEATRCSAGITGRYIFETGTGETRPCKIERQTGLYETGCLFVPERKQNSSASIMYMQSLSSVTRFCDQTNHNIQATNMQNDQCGYRSTWEVIMDSADFARSSPITETPPPPTVSLLQTQVRVVCLVLDVSESMRSHNRIHRLRQAAELFILQVIEKDSWVGIVTFESTAKIVTGLQQVVSDSVRKSLANYLPTTAGGGTKICSGVRAGFQVFLSKYGSTEGCEIVLLTDDEDSDLRSCFAEAERSGSKIHTIALGPKAAKELETLANMTGGLKFSATDSLDSNSLIDAFCGLSSGSGSVFQQSIQLGSKSQSIGISQSLSGVVSIDKSLGNDTFFMVTWSLSTSPPTIILMDPRGKRYLQADFVVDNTNVRLARLKIDGTAKAGDWAYSIQNTHYTAQVISMTVTTRAASLSEPPVTVKPYLKRDTNNPMIIYAEVSQGFLPVIGAKVIVTVEPESGTAVELELLDNGAGADILKHDGVYSRYFTSFKGNGRYNLKVHVQGKEETVRRVRRQSQALYIPGYILGNGSISLNPPKPVYNKTKTASNFVRIHQGGSFIVTNSPPPGVDLYPPNKIRDLKAMPVNNGDEFHLTWTAPGDDYDSGTAERYEIRMSENPAELTDATFQSATPVNTSGLKPAPFGTKEFFQFKPAKKSNKAVFFAIRAIDDNNNVGNASNIAQAGHQTSQLPPIIWSTTTKVRTTHSVSLTTWLLPEATPGFSGYPISLRSKQQPPHYCLAGGVSDRKSFKVFLLGSRLDAQLIGRHGVCLSLSWGSGPLPSLGYRGYYEY
ncbi:calcium-activated chloride channel regulator 1-like [Tiliqua scincoides]|uniref:calcium-activated chloride channel regulator 1-like n=1 Tax=Tiliqua scincoides TaxID=71010 RepID=UPI00346214EE